MSKIGTDEIVKFATEKFATEKHEAKKQKYAKHFPYVMHLHLVMASAMTFMPDGLSKEKEDLIVSSVYLHDVLEDTDTTFEELVEFCGETLAVITRRLTTIKGGTRKQRHSPEYYAGIAECPIAVFVKLCDRHANLNFAVLTNQTGFIEMYSNEMPDFLRFLASDWGDKPSENSLVPYKLIHALQRLAQS